MRTPDALAIWRRLAPTRVQPDDNPFSVRLRKYLTGTHLLLAAGGAAVAPTPRRCLWQRGPVRLWRYTSPGPMQRVPIVVVYAMILRPYILDLTPGRSLIERLVDAGHDVWLVDWGDPSPADSGIALDAYTGDFLRDAIATVTATADCDDVTLLGHGQGGTIAAIYAALHPDEVRNLVLLAAPIDFAPRQPHAVGSWSLWSRQRWYDPRTLVGPGSNLPTHLPGRAIAAWSAPVATAIPWVKTMRQRLMTTEEGRVWLGACQWVDDSPPISGAAFVQWLEGCYQRNDLVHDRMRVEDTPVRLADVGAAVLSITGRRDVITPPHQAARPEHFPSAAGFSAIAAPAGHVGLVVGPTARAGVHEPLVRWLASQSG